MHTRLLLLGLLCSSATSFGQSPNDIIRDSKFSLVRGRWQFNTASPTFSPTKAFRFEFDLDDETSNSATTKIEIEIPDIKNSPARLEMELEEAKGKSLTIRGQRRFLYSPVLANNAPERENVFSAPMRRDLGATGFPGPRLNSPESIRNSPALESKLPKRGSKIRLSTPAGDIAGAVLSVGERYYDYYLDSFARMVFYEIPQFPSFPIPVAPVARVQFPVHSPDTYVIKDPDVLDKKVRAQSYVFSIPKLQLKKLTLLAPTGLAEITLLDVSVEQVVSRWKDDKTLARDFLALLKGEEVKDFLGRLVTAEGRANYDKKLTEVSALQAIYENGERLINFRDYAYGLNDLYSQILVHSDWPRAEPKDQVTLGKIQRFSDLFQTARTQ